MKKLLIFFLLLTLTFQLYTCFAQNLVPNPSFEEYDTCPNNFTQVKYAIGWSTYGIDAADYYNACAIYPETPASFSVPYNTLGYQNAYDGNAYCGLITYSHPPAESNYREYISAQLTSPLIQGNKYYVSMKISCADKELINFGASNNLGFLFTTYPYNFYYPDTLVRNFSQIHENLIISDTANWTSVLGSFIADSTYSFINIGNFYSDSLTNYYNSSSNSNKQAYYYVDMVCVSLDSLTCYGHDNIPENNINNEIEFYPNPSSNFIKIKLNGSYTKPVLIDIYNICGIKVRQCLINESDMIDVSDFLDGVYIAKASINGGILYKKIVINH